jgi:hypothetical protein
LLSVLDKISGTKFTLLLISLTVVFTIIDSQFIRVFYGTQLGIPGNFHSVLFVSLVIYASIINIIFITLAKRNDAQARISRPLLFRIAYLSTFGAQVAVLLMMYLAISEMLIFHAYDRVFLLLVIVVSNFLSVLMFGILSFIFLQWLRLSRSLSILIYALVFIVILFVVLTTLPLLVVTHSTQTADEAESVSPKAYKTLVLGYFVPSTTTAFVFGLGTYALPIVAIASWILTVSLLKGYTNRIGKKKFWFLVSIPLAYQVFVVIVSNPNLVTDPNLIEIVYSSNPVSGSH